MKPKYLKKLLLSEIKSVSASANRFSIDPERDFTRKRKLPIEKLMSMIIAMGGGSLSNEVIRMFHYSADAATSSAFVQQRSKLNPEAFYAVFRSFTNKLTHPSNEKMRILAVDGTDLHIFTDKNDKETYFPGTNGQKPYNLLHINAMYDVDRNIYLDAMIQKRYQINEHVALCKMVDRSDIKSALVIADRYYESYNDMAHIQEKGWKFLIRIKDGKCKSIKNSLSLPDTPEFDMDVHLSLTRKQTLETKKLFLDKNRYRFVPANVNFDFLPTKCNKHVPLKFYDLSFRIVRFKISADVYETVLTNLNRDDFPPDALKKLYARRWGIETSFRNLKYTLGLSKLHSKKVMCIFQEIFAHLIMYNFAIMITASVTLKKKQRKHTYIANFAVAVCMCRSFYLGDTSPPDLEAVIARSLIPLRTNRQAQRGSSGTSFQGFLYRVS